MCKKARWPDHFYTDPILGDIDPWWSGYDTESFVRGRRSYSSGGGVFTLNPGRLYRYSC
tara:strand:+ start:123676 stop:123852 length:177 start_codon:yes stop_codon:yes gene_type:complete